MKTAFSKLAVAALLALLVGNSILYLDLDVRLAMFFFVGWACGNVVDLFWREAE